MTKNIRFCNKCNCDTERIARGDCKPCKKLSTANWYQLNKEKIADHDHAYRAANKEKISAYGVTYRSENLEAILIRSKKWRSENRGYIAEWRAKNPQYDENWRSANPEKIAAWAAVWRAANPEISRLHVQNRRARKLANGGVLSKDLTKKLLKLQKNKCAACKEVLGVRFHLDHIMPLSLGGSNTDNNIQLLHATCNHQKSAKHPIDFMQQRGFLL